MAVDLGTLGGPSAWPLDINNAGQVVGWAYAATYPADYGHASIWDEASGMLDLGALGGYWASEAEFVNDLGQGVGVGEMADHVMHAFFWDPVTGMVDLPMGPSGAHHRAHRQLAVGRGAGPGRLVPISENCPSRIGPCRSGRCSTARREHWRFGSSR